MSGIAEVLLNLGFRVTGSDTRQTEITERLVRLGAHVFYGHREDNVQDSHVVVVSSAVRPDNPEVQDAHRRAIPVIQRAEMLAELMRMKYSVAVAGHTAKRRRPRWSLPCSEAQSSIPLRHRGKAQQPRDERKARARASILSPRRMRATAPSSYCSRQSPWSPNRPGTPRLLSRHRRDQGGLPRVHEQGALLRPRDPLRRQRESREPDTFAQKKIYDVWSFGKGRTEGGQSSAQRRFPLQVRCAPQRPVVGRGQPGDPGVHNVVNALAAIAVGMELDIGFDVTAAALGQFSGIHRRLELKWDGDIKLVDDYGHHPTEIRATLAALRSMWKGRIIVAFQPHRYSRTKALQGNS